MKNYATIDKATGHNNSMQNRWEINKNYEIMYTI